MIHAITASRGHVRRSVSTTDDFRDSEPLSIFVSAREEPPGSAGLLPANGQRPTANG
jgi:hypothetical protein